MKYRTVPRAELSTNRWSGGATTQLAIWPENALYADRSFVWRVSSATIEDEESDFTLLPGYVRILMVLDGALSLIHEHGQPVPLGRFGQARFYGGVHTLSRGRATDLNLMFRTGADGFVEALHIPVGRNAAIALHSQAYTRHSEIFYVYEGGVAVTLPNGETAVVRDGGVLTVHCGDGDAGAEISFAALQADSGAVVIRAGVFYDN